MNASTVISDTRSLWNWILLCRVLVPACCALWSGGCSTMTIETASRRLDLNRDLPVLLARVPAPEVVREGMELETANAFAAAVNLGSAATGARRVQAYWGVGDSMEPLYATHTAIVVTPCDFAGLRPGMMVLYRDADGWGIAHVLVESGPEGWTAQGVNCAEADPCHVTPENLVGVVTHAYAAVESAGRKTMVAMVATLQARSAPLAPPVPSTDRLLALQSGQR